MNTPMSAATAQGVRRWWDADGGWSTADAAGTPADAALIPVVNP
jgi:hypothetical protein